MEPTTSVILVAAGFVVISAAIFLKKYRIVFISLLSAAFILFAAPFYLHWYYTRDAYEWKIVVERDLGDIEDPEVIYIDRIEWITDYEVLKRQRHHVGSLILDDETTYKEWRAKGYIPVGIRASILFGSNEVGVSRSFNNLGAGSYLLTLKFNENDVGIWSIEPWDPDGDAEK
jgi:hypothetical protein